MNSSLPILYSFRRCPYAMRARLAIVFSEQRVELREVVLKNKPPVMLDISPKGTVPVLQLADGSVIDESRDIMLWALSNNDPLHLMAQSTLDTAIALIDENDKEFKYWLDRYKYADRYPELTQRDYRHHGEVFLQKLEALLGNHSYLLGEQPSIADIGLMPFVRQFAHVDKHTFQALPYPKLQAWLQTWLDDPFFLTVMQKYPAWQEGDEVTVFPKARPD